MGKYVKTIANSHSDHEHHLLESKYEQVDLSKVVKEQDKLII